MKPAEFLHLFTPLDHVVGQLTESQLDAQSQCSEWTRRQVIDHILSTQLEFLARHHIELPQLPRTPSHTSITHHQETLRPIGEHWNTPINGLAGPSTIGETLGLFYGFDLIVHRWDIGAGTPAHTPFTETEMDLIEGVADTFAQLLYSQGVCAPAVPTPPDASRETKLLARLGRQHVDTAL